MARGTVLMGGKETTWTRKKKAIVIGVVALAAVVLLGGGVARATILSESQDATTDVVTETVQAGDISQNVTGTGSLASDKAVNVLVPADLEVVQVLVAEGDTVEVGTPIAQVSPASVREKQLAIEENIDSLRKQLENLGSGTTHYDLRKQVLEEQIADLERDRDIMAHLQETCILESDTAGVVQKVSLSEGTMTGKTSLREQGSESSGNQQNRQETDGSDGQAMEASQVAAGPDEAVATPATMPASSMPVATTAAVRFHNDDRACKLVDQDVGQAASSGANDAGGENDVGQEKGASDVSDGSADTGRGVASDAGAEQGSSSPADDGGSNGQGSADSGTQGNDAAGDNRQDGGNGSSEEPAPTTISGAIKLAVTPPVTGAVPQDTLVLPEDTPYTATIRWAPESETFAAQTEYVCTIYLTANDGYCFAQDPNKLDVTVPSSIAGRYEALDLDDDGIAETLKVEAAFSATAASEQEIDVTVDEELPDMGGIDGGISFGGGYSAGGDDSSSLTKAGSSYSDTEAVALTVTPSDKVYLDVKIDELDILKVSVGQQAQVTLDALPDREFVGTVAKIGNAEGKAQEGSSVKYTARIELPRDENMRYGMSAKATISVGEAKDVALIPIDAVSDVDGTTVVYTSVDENGVLGSPVTVTTGLSDGERVQVIEGLSVGDTVCYIPTTSGDDEDLYY